MEEGGPPPPAPWGNVTWNVPKKSGSNANQSPDEEAPARPDRHPRKQAELAVEGDQAKVESTKGAAEPNAGA